MNITKLFNTKTTLGVCGAGLCMLVAQPCVAQSAACVNILVGAGFAGWMGVLFNGNYYWSGLYPIGQHRCIALPVDGMVNGSIYYVRFTALLGQDNVPCDPAPSSYSSSDTNAVTYEHGELRPM